MRLINVKLGRSDEEEFYKDNYETQKGGAFNYAKKNRREFINDFGDLSAEREGQESQ